jgi:hypothetical protein
MTDTNPTTWIAGADYVDYFTLVDSEGTPITGETFTADKNIGPGDTTIDFTITEVGGGVYRMGWILVEGNSYLRIVTDTADPRQIYEFEVHTGAYDVGDTITDHFTLLDLEGNYIGGEAFTGDTVIGPNDEAFAYDIVDLGDGLYRVQWEADAIGVYFLKLSTTTFVQQQVFEFEEFVLAAFIDLPSPLEPVTGSSLDELVRAVAVQCGDYLRTRATQTSLQADTWTDELNCAVRSPKYFQGASFFCTNAAIADNIGIERRVRDSFDNGVYVTPALPGTPVAGDSGYFTNLNSQGFTRDTYVEQINSAIASIFPEHLVPAAWEFPDVFDGTVGYVEPPIEFTHLYAVQYPYSGCLIDVPFNQYPDQPGWWWDAARQRLWLGGEYLRSANGAAITIFGFGRDQPLVESTDMTSVSHEWIVESCAAVLIMSLHDARRMAEAMAHKNNADALRLKTATTTPPNTLRIR